MTLRVKISIVPFGNETKEYVIETINISNVGEGSGATYKYVVEHNKYKKVDENTPTVEHLRADGPLSLVKKAIEKLNIR